MLLRTPSIDSPSLPECQGHFEMKLCNTDDLDDPQGVVTTKCLEMHQLDRAPDDGDASPIDPDHPGRYYPVRNAKPTDANRLETGTGFGCETDIAICRPYIAKKVTTNNNVGICTNCFNAKRIMHTNAKQLPRVHSRMVCGPPATQAGPLLVISKLTGMNK